MQNDFELLREFVASHSEEAFRQLVERHGGMVHGAARRMLRDEHLAEEVTQAVFIIFLQKAPSLGRGTTIAGWLYKTTRFVAMEKRRAEQRRKQHQENFAQMNLSSEAASVWERVAPLLEDSMHQLGAKERDALVLRFFEGRSFAEVGASLEISEAAAKMRVARGLDKLRELFARQGVSTSAAALLAALTAHSVTAMPAPLSAGALAAVTIQTIPTGMPITTLEEGALKTMTWNKVKSCAIAAAVALLLVGVALVVTRTDPTPKYVTSLQPMEGEWEGTFEFRASRFGKRMQQPVALTIRTTNDQRVCDIEMRIPAPAGRPSIVYRFTHSLNETGDGIETMDDPQIGRLHGEAPVTESLENRERGEWRAGFRAPHQNDDGFTECRWVRKGNELSITRHDFMKGAQTSHLFSELRLRRLGEPNPVQSAL